MASRDSTWRTHPFEKGVTYVAQVSFDGRGGAHFMRGRLYVFQGVGYSHYDATTFFRFVEQGRSEVFFWEWHDTEPDALCDQRFKALAGNA
jgi:hypothetical protein